MGARRRVSGVSDPDRAYCRGSDGPGRVPPPDDHPEWVRATENTPLAPRSLDVDLSEPAGQFKVAGDEARAQVGRPLLPDADRLGREHPVAERDQDDATRPQHPRQLAQGLDRPRQVLDRDGDHHGVERGVGVRQAATPVQVVDDPLAQAGVRRQLRGVHPEAGNPAERELGGRRQVGDPRAHQVEQVGAQRHVPPDRVGDAGDRVVVDVLDEARLVVEPPIRRLVDADEPVGRGRGGGHPRAAPVAVGGTGRAGGAAASMVASALAHVRARRGPPLHLEARSRPWRARLR
ncbi:MAG: hypothetical protein AVDCRST_MAG59-4836 [uncultured Thermomicrobiales bacterium]|uniref:Uncharacterized protein n=1 Tax=uncultured Thermomicrobiales bacterium TaxID=1645740 RepID=A0A6J4VKN8_9BACT|nr:MAG: hypothetical protein AVDCRST_MAG59-4836 [uncultured Thermomicrobiales bacterium]